VVKADEDASPIIRLAIASRALSESQLTDLVTTVVESRLAAVGGVAAANSYGLRARTIEVRVRQVALAARGLGQSDLIAAIENASVTAP
jgi:multidrug efflux pump subunit AcrB